MQLDPVEGVELLGHQVHAEAVVVGQLAVVLAGPRRTGTQQEQDYHTALGPLEEEEEEEEEGASLYCTGGGSCVPDGPPSRT